MRIIPLHQRRELQAAIDGYRELLRDHPRHFDALRLLGAALLAQGQAREAEAVLEQALQVYSGSAETWTLFGDALAQGGRHPNAAQSYERALALGPRTAALCARLGNQWLALERHVEAESAFREALAYDPTSAEAWCNLGIILQRLHRTEEALAAHQRAAVLAPESTEILANLAQARLQAQDPTGALQSYEILATRMPQSAQTWQGKAACLTSLGRIREALDCCDRALYLLPSPRADTPVRDGDAEPINQQRRQLRFNRSLLLLTLGHFKEGWAEYELRAGIASNAHVPPNLPHLQPGQDLRGKVVLVTCEQGLGDTLQFVRFVVPLMRRGACCVLRVQPELQSLLVTFVGELAGGGDRVRLESEGTDVADAWCRLCSLPYVLSLVHEEQFDGSPYLRVPPAALRTWRERVPEGREPVRVGLAHSGNAQHANDRQRSIALARFERVCDLDGVEWHLLQKDLSGDDEPCLQRLGIIDHRSEIRDFSDTAALAARMDLIVSVDTALAHLAGALGLRMLVLVALAPDWRWQLERVDSPWYASAQLIRQERYGDWTDALHRLESFLRRAVGAKAGVAPV